VQRRYTWIGEPVKARTAREGAGAAARARGRVAPGIDPSDARCHTSGSGAPRSGEPGGSRRG